MRIIRVFPQRTSYTPDDDMVFIGEPPGLYIPDRDKTHISCTFTWDMDYCFYLKEQWEMFTDKPVFIGGPAFVDNPCDTFTPGMYVKKGITFTSRGCNKLCPWCAVPKKEGKLRPLQITEGNIIQDNNFLQCSPEHQSLVFEMLKTQKGICFKGGLQANLIDEYFIEELEKLSIKELWLSCDTDAALPGFKKAAKKLIKAGYTRNKIKCYVLIGHNMELEEKRLQAVYNEGAMPFAQLYQPSFCNSKLEYSREWKMFARQWQRPAATIAHMERGTNMKDYNT